MKRFSSILCMSIALAAFAMPAAAQDNVETEKKADSLKAEKTAPKQDDIAAEDSIDLDSFFKKGEENAKNGASCDKPATPADPVA